MRPFLAAVLTTCAILPVAACGGEERFAPVEARRGAATAPPAMQATARSASPLDRASTTTTGEADAAGVPHASTRQGTGAQAGGTAGSPLTALLRDRLMPLGGADRESASSAASLAGLDRFRYALTFEMNASCTAAGGRGGGFGEEQMTMTVAGAYVASDQHRLRCTGSFGGETIDDEVIVIGDESWVRDARSRGTFIRGSSEYCRPDLCVTDFAGTFGEYMSGFAVVGEERVGGVVTTHYRVTYGIAEILRDLAEGFGAEAGDVELVELSEADFAMSVDLWLSKGDAWPVKLVFRIGGSADGGSFEMVARWEMSEINAPSVTVAAP